MTRMHALSTLQGSIDEVSQDLRQHMAPEEDNGTLRTACTSYRMLTARLDWNSDISLNALQMFKCHGRHALAIGIIPDSRIGHLSYLGLPIAFKYMLTHLRIDIQGYHNL